MLLAGEVNPKEHKPEWKKNTYNFQFQSTAA